MQILRDVNGGWKFKNLDTISLSKEDVDFRCGLNSFLWRREMGSQKPDNLLISLLAVMSLLMVLFGLFREVALIQSENANAHENHDYKQLSTDIRTDIQNGSQSSIAQIELSYEEQLLGHNLSDDSINDDKNMEQAGSGKE